MDIEFDQSQDFEVGMEEETIIVEFSDEDEFVCKFGDGSSADTYTGEYEVTPRIYEQTLETEGKQMSDDVTVYEIPITRTTNPHGGQTVVIG